ncbi:MAG: A/G-specific adenine glycosylase, partial [Lentisphaeria bacterium]|nr:A/G-specific adenine glycosylase [Lentisphaeria bacterium]
MKKEAELLLAWYKENGRTLPWRVRGKAHPDPYAVWVSEIMLQQTTVKTVCDYFERWMKRFPTLHSLADASLDDVLRQWQGLGYYTRAKKMHACALFLQEHFNGTFPADRVQLLTLPGIGPYTASSLCAFAFNMPETVIDGNVIRVLSRYYGITGTVERKNIEPYAAALTPQESAADYASAIMDLGATVCTPTAPKCSTCPWEHQCTAHSRHLEEKIPQLKKTVKKKKKGALFILYSPDNKLFIRKRPGKGLLSGLWEIPWHEEMTFPFKAEWTELPGKVRHIFTHFELELLFFTTGDPLPEEFTATGIFVS